MIYTEKIQTAEDGASFSGRKCRTGSRRRLWMIVEIDFNSDEALYLQLCNQIIMGIASSRFREGDSLPSVRQMADTIGINMHTVNKAYSILRQEGYLKLDRRRGAVIAVDTDRMRMLEELKKELQIILAKSSCKNISKEEIHELIEEIYEDYI
jgi:GntR family transcriptional regulator